MACWAEFQPLKSCVIGTLPGPDHILPYTNLKNRYKKYFEKIVLSSIEELDNLEKILNNLNIKTHRSEQNYPFYNGKTINTPPLAVRDFFTVYGNSLFKSGLAFDWNRNVSESCDYAINLSEYDLIHDSSTKEIFYDADFIKFDPDRNLPRPLFHTALSLKCGNDIIIAKRFGKDGNKLGGEEYVKWIRTVNPDARIHLLDTEGHIDSQIFLVRPGLMLTALPDHKLPAFFDKWEKIHVESPVDQMFHKKNKFRHKKFHPVIAEVFYNFLQTCTEETYFTINSLSVNESTVLFTGEHPSLFRQLNKKGVDCIPVQMKATTFWDNGVHCCTNELQRVGDLEDYT